MFHLYGFIIGSASVVGLLLCERRFLVSTRETDEVRAQTFFWRTVVVVMLTGVIGARIWHVMTDWYLYHDAWLDMFKVWQGGLSILGALAGGVSGLWLVTYRLQKNNPVTSRSLFFALLDISVFGLPFAQAIGRIGNYVNQELYGWSTTLPWGMEINGQRYHPLWAYEAMLMLFFGTGVWLIDRRQYVAHQKLTVGSGNLFLIYLGYYSVVRFWLDFLRPDKALLAGTSLGVNQVVVLIVACGIIGWYLYKGVLFKTNA